MKSQRELPVFASIFAASADCIPDDAVMECKICWMRYEPGLGDEVWQIPADTPFSQLPEDWRCPQCDGDKRQFIRVLPAQDQNGDQNNGS